MIYKVCSLFKFLWFWGCMRVGGWWVFKLIFLSIYMPRVKYYGKFNNTDSTKVHTVPFMLHISSTPVVKYLAVIRAYLFKWWGNIEYHKFSAETGQWLSTDVCQLGKMHLSVCTCTCMCVFVRVVAQRMRSMKMESLCHHEADWRFPQHLYLWEEGKRRNKWDGKFKWQPSDAPGDQ